MKPVLEATTKHPTLGTTRKPSGSTTQRTTTTVAPSLDGYPEEPASDIEKTCSEGRLFMPHETDCNKYYQCDHGMVHEQR